MLYLFSDEIDNAHLESKLEFELGKYYSTLINVINTDGYKVEKEGFKPSYYGLISISDFLNVINEK